MAEAVAVVAAIAGHLKWAHYCFQLRHYLRQLSKRKDIQKTLIRLAAGTIALALAFLSTCPLLPLPGWWSPFWMPFTLTSPGHNSSRSQRQQR